MSSDESNSAESMAADAPAAQPLFSWGTDLDDFDFEDPQPSHFTAPTAAIMPTVASCPSRIIPSMPPVPAPPTMSNYVGASELPRLWDASSDTQATRYFTHSQASQMPSLSLGSLAALSISIALNPTQAPQPQSILELLGENHHLKMMVNLMAMEVAKAKANNPASNAHCTIMT
jgi:hypothetical protein